MIFVTVGTHPGQFDRLIRRIDEIAPKIKEEIVIQRGFTKYIPKNVKSFDFADDLDQYFKKARIVISHSATTVLEFILKYKKSIITVPRQKKFGEHLNDHQVEFALYLEDKIGIKAILDVAEITPGLIKKYSGVPRVDKKNLILLQNYFRTLLEGKNE